VRYAKAQPDGHAELTVNEWVDIAQQNRHITGYGTYRSHADEGSSMYGEIAGLSGDDLQIRTLGHIATAIVKSGLLAVPTAYGYHSEIALLHVPANPKG
jgi:hypothetical protein